MSARFFVGIDPGPVPGIVLIDLPVAATPRLEVIQCSRGVAPVVLRALVESLNPTATPPLIQIERFVVGRRAGRSGTAKAGEQTRDLIGQLIASVPGLPAESWRARAAGEVKPWATDERLEAAGLLEATKGMRHARDAARHALFVAVKDGGVPDPLSRKAEQS